MFKVEDTQFLINTANPFNIIGVANQIKKMKPDLVIIQWWHPYFAPCYSILTRFLKNTKILFICHNVFPHERFPMDKFLTRMTLKHGDCYIVQSRQDEEDLKTIIKNPIYKRTVHPTYNAFKMQNMSKEQAREKLKISNGEKVLLFFGFVREYKGLKHLIKAMPLIQQKLDLVRLMVVGDFGDDKQSYLDLIQESHCEKTIDICDGYIPDQEVEKYFAACDLVVCPYESATQSGIIQIAYGFDKPVVATNVGGLPDVVADKKTGYLVEPKNPEAIADVVIDFYDNKRELEYAEHIQESAYEFSWERMVEIISDLMDK